VEKMKFRYGMKLRGFSPGAQPRGVVEWEDANKQETGFWSIVVYDRELTEAEINNYDVEKIES